MKTSIQFILAGSLGLLVFVSCNTGHRNGPKKNYVDLAAMDTSVRPQDNFFMYANGNWLKNTKIPPTESSWGSFNILREKSTKDLHMILDSLSKIENTFADGSNEKMTADLYISGMDSTQIEKNGIDPLKKDLSIIASIKAPEGILKEVAREDTSGAVAFHGNFLPANIIDFYAYQDDKNSEKVVAHFDQGELGLPTKDYYFPKDSATKKIKEQYQVYVSKIFQLLGNDKTKADKIAGDILDLETKLADASKSPVELRDHEANYHKFTVSELDKKMPGMHWSELVKDLKINVDTLLIGQPKYYESLSKLIYSVPLETWKQYLQFRLVDNFAGVLSKNFSDANFDFYGKILSGQKEQRPRWKRMSDMVNRELGDALGQIYVQKFFPPEAKRRMMTLVNNLQESYKQRIEKADWMDSITKVKAVKKLMAIIKKIGYPDKWKDYKGVVIVKDDPVANLKSTHAYKYRYMIAKLGKPVDKTEWFMTPSTVNAYYNPNVNEIVFPAGILQPPFFNKNADDAVNYGAIGMVIGHEITHGFDDQGRKFDAKGNLKDWWTKEDAKRYNEHAQKIIDQFNKYTILDSLHLNGKLTQGENIADLGGLIIAYNAFKMTAEGKSDKKIDGFTPEQRFFLSYAHVWQNKRTDQIARQLVMTDPHSPPLYRVNGPLSNMPEFYAAFNVKPGDKMYRPDSLRVKVW